MGQSYTPTVIAVTVQLNRAGFVVSGDWLRTETDAFQGTNTIPYIFKYPVGRVARMSWSCALATSFEWVLNVNGAPQHTVNAAGLGGTGLIPSIPVLLGDAVGVQITNVVGNLTELSTWMSIEVTL